MISMNRTSDNLTAALEWEAAGCSVIPIRADGSKKPAFEWKLFQKTRPTRAQITQWWIDNPEYGIAVICGAVSGGLEMTELEARATDGAHFDKIQEVADVEFDNWDKWVLGHRTYAEITPSGGIHLLYRLADGVVPGNTKLANALDNNTLAETRGEGGYVIVAPTGGRVHSTGESWTAINGCLPAGIKTIPFELRTQLHGVLRTALDERPPIPAAPVERVTIEPRHEGEMPGEAFERVTSWAEILQPHGWTYSHRIGQEIFWTRPGKENRDGHSASTGHANDRDRLYIWSSAAGLPTETPLTKFYVYAELNHRGDMAAAAAELRRQGFGTDRPLVREPENFDMFVDPGEQEQRPEKAVEATESKEQPKRKLRARRLSTFALERTKWLWKNRIPLGEITMMGGREGTGKSSILAKWAAEVTTGEMDGEFFGQPRNLIYIAAEDSMEKTLHPRMIAAGADPNRIIILDVDPESGDFGSPDFPVDCKELERMIEENDAAVVMFDPLLSNISTKINVNHSRELRTVLEPLRKVAERTECAIIGLAHFNKSTGSDVSSKFTGSRAFLEVARSVFSVAKMDREKPDEQDMDEFFEEQPQRFILDQEKLSLAANDHRGIVYEIVGAKLRATNGEEIETNKVIFVGETDVRVEEVLNKTVERSKESVQDKVVAFVKKEFSKGNLLVGAQSVVERFSDVHPSSLRSALSRAVSGGHLACPRRGQYGPPGAIGGGHFAAD